MFLKPRAWPTPSIISVLVKAGSTTEKCSPLRRFSRRMASVKPSTACLVAEYVAMPGTGMIPLADATCPHPDCCELGAEYHAVSVDSKNSPGDGVGLIDSLTDRDDACIVDEYIDGSQPFFDCVEEAFE